MDFEGRNSGDFDELSVMSLYLPSGQIVQDWIINLCLWMISKLHYRFKERDS
jgi:hypothetical protein